MTVVAGIDFIDLPPVSTSFPGKRLEEGPRRICFRNTADEGCRHTGLAVLGKTKRFLEAAETEITKSLTHKVSRLSWLESPEIQLTFSSRQTPSVAMLSGDIAKEGAHLRREQVHYALPIFWYEGV